MKISLAVELYTFFCAVILGLTEGFIFDLFRIFRKFTGKSFFAVCVADIIYWILAAVFFIVTVDKINSGEIRLYILSGVAVGLLLYFLLLSRTIITVFFRIIKLFLQIFKLILKILLTPAVFLYKILLEPFFRKIKIICINFAKKSKKFGVGRLRKKNDKKEK